MRYNVSVHQSGLYLLYIVLELSIDPSSTPRGRGQLPWWDVTWLALAEVTNELSRKDLKSRAWVPMTLFTPSILPPTVHQNLPKPFSHMWISVTPNKQKHRIPSFKNFEQPEFIELATPFHESSYIVIYTYIEVVI